MDRDSKIYKLIRETGIVPAPRQFTGYVMDKIESEPGKKIYKPIIGRDGRIIIIILILGTVLLSILFSEPGSKLTENRLKLPEMNITLDFLSRWQLPEMSFSLNFLSDINISTGLLSALVAVFILVLSDAGLSRRRLV
ncbi:MAG: hypothetical protein KAR19_06295 [Bacteroidales bacterium]|nr:hypothetical protein [Bacteroidales bacterium]